MKVFNEKEQIEVEGIDTGFGNMKVHIIPDEELNDVKVPKCAAKVFEKQLKSFKNKIKKYK